jgi:O-antigen ligase
MIFGLFSAFIANSRSPIAALIICIIFYAIASRNYKMQLMFILSLVLIIIFIDNIDSILQTFGSGFVERILSTINNSAYSDVTSGRNILYRIGLEQFKDSPFIGSSFLIALYYATAPLIRSSRQRSGTHTHGRTLCHGYALFPLD